jgi:hypothetical protein
MSGVVTVTAGYGLPAGGVLTTSKLNRLGAEVSARIGAGEIGTRELADGSIPLDKLDADIQAQVGVANGAISTAKLAANALSADGTGRSKMGALFVTEAKLADGAVGADALGAGAVTAGKLASGIGVGNVAMGTLTSVVTLAANAWVDITGLTVTITPSRNASKVLIMVHVTGSNSGTGASTMGLFLRLKRGGTVLTTGTASGSRVSCMGVIQGSISGVAAPVNGALIFLDTPGSTGAATYQVQARTYVSGGGNHLQINRGRTDTDSADFARGACSIVAMELLA